MKKEHLIPFDKSKRVIYLEERGKDRKKGKKPALILAIAGILCLIYCLAIFFFMGYGTRFFLIWGVIAIACEGFAWLFWQRRWLQRLPGWLRRACGICFLIGLSVFLIVEGLIFSQFGATAQPGADYVIVLGVQWKTSGPSYVLRERLDKAVEYLKANPDTKVIVSGGQGSNEPISEAEGMRDYLVNAGIEAERIIMEDKSTSTQENLMFCGKLLDRENDRVVLISNNYHMYRAGKIAEKQGYARLERLSAGSYPGMLPNNLLREFLAVLKDFAVGNM